MNKEFLKEYGMLSAVKRMVELGENSNVTEIHAELNKAYASLLPKKIEKKLYDELNRAFSELGIYVNKGNLIKNSDKIEIKIDYIISLLEKA